MMASQTIRRYLIDFWSPEKVSLFWFSLLICLVGTKHSFYFILCRSGNQEPDHIQCLSSFTIENAVVPIVQNYEIILSFSLLLLFLPLPLLRYWFRRVGFWLIPLSIVVWLTTFSDPHAPSGIGPNPGAAFGSSTVIMYLVSVWIASIVGVVAYYRYKRL